MTRSLTHPLLLFLIVWTTAIALYVGAVHAGTFPAPGAALWAAVVLSVGGFVVGYLTWAAFRRLLPPAEPVPSGTTVLSPEEITRLLRWTGFMGLFALALAAYRTTVIASTLGTTVSELLSHPALLRDGFAMFVTAGVFEANWIVVLNSVANSLFSIGFILLGVFLHVGADRRKYVYLFAFLLITLTTGLTSVSRYEVTVNIMYMVFAYCLVCSLDRRQAAGHRLLNALLPLVAVAVLFFLIDLLLHKSADYDQPTHLQGFFYHVFWYVASPLAALNELLTSFDGHYHLGQYTFFPLYKWLSRFHLAPEADISVFGEFVLIPYAANVYTYLRNFYEDFGMPGVVAGPYLLGLSVSVLKASAGRYFPCLNLYVICLVFILFSFYNFFLFSNQVYLQILFGFLLFRRTLPTRDLPLHSEPRTAPHH